MALPTSGPLSLNDIQTEFGGTNPISLSEYYAGGGLVPAGTTGTNGAVPSSGAISIFNFYGTAASALGITYTFRGYVNGLNFYENAPTDIVWNDSIFVTVGERACLSTSTDGISWTFSTNLRDTAWGSGNANALAWNGSIFCVVGAGGRVATSTNGTTWTYQTGLASTSWGTVDATDIIWTGTKFVIVGPARVAESTDGATWTVKATTLPRPMTSPDIAFNGTIYVMSGVDSSVTNAAGVVTSTDLVTWTFRSVGAFNDDNDYGLTKGVAWNGTVFVLVGDSPTDSATGATATSTNGTSWTTRVLGLPDFTGVTTAGSTIVYLMAADNSSIISTDNGVTKSELGNTQLRRGAYGFAYSSSLGRYVYVGQDSGNTGDPYVTSVSYSATIQGTYTEVVLGNISSNFNTETIYHIGWNGTTFLATGLDGQVATSTDGVTYTYQGGLRSTSWGTTSDPFALAVGGSTFLVAGTSGRVATSTNGSTWTYQGGLAATTWSTTNVNSAIWNGSIFAVIGADKYATSPDGVTWTYSATKFVRGSFGIPSVTDAGTPDAMIWTGSTLVVGSSAGFVYTSSNATTSTPNLAVATRVLSSGLSTAFRAFASASSSSVVAVTSRGIYTSTSPFTSWTQRNSGTTWRDINYNSTTGLYVVVGDSGAVATSPDGVTWTSQTSLQSTAYGTADAQAIGWNGTSYSVMGTYGVYATSL